MVRWPKATSQARWQMWLAARCLVRVRLGKGGGSGACLPWKGQSTAPAKEKPHMNGRYHVWARKHG